MWDSLAPAAAPAHVSLVLEAVAASGPRCGTVTVVGVDGPSGSGKSTLASSVALALGCPLLRMDDFYPGWDGLVDGVRILAEQVLTPLCRGEDATVARWDWVAGQPSGELVVRHTPLLVVDGVGSTARPAADHVAVRVWVEAAPALRRSRGIARDGDAYEPFWEHWAAQERALFTADDTRSRADVVIDTSHL